ncbi:conserved hypothetical protein [uncultured Desulfatiglans sp.]|uniref:Uncharacterized protein n=1 Tax=Uncultured Desulfatiglans sp. TaxID=1748965 RepID=A0A653A469_UNCDX|nr:conserved hypothetical protein [uncultured Desulfatiglans sp.]
MSCYFRYMKDVLEEAGVVITAENKQSVDRIVHSLVDVPYKDCSPAWKAVKEQIRNDPGARERFIQRLKGAMAGH